MDKYFTTKDKIKLRYKEDYVENPKAVIVIVHGFAEHIGRYDYITEILNKNGYSIFRYDARGHGLSTGKLGHMDSYNEMVDDLFEVVGFVKSKNKGIKIYTLGHSMGGNITANFGIKFSNVLDGQLFSGAALGYITSASGLAKPIIKLISKPFSKMYMKSPVDNYISSDEEVVEAYKKDALVLKKATFGFLNQFAVESSDNIFKNTKKYSYPCYIGHGGADKIVLKEASKRFYNEISSTDKTLKIYEGLYHEIFNEKSKDQVIADYVRWLNNKCE